jgi:hypothetical protein
MKNTKFSLALLPDVTPFNISADGHLIGTDNFIVPKNFSEFAERFPGAIEKFVAKNYSQASAEERARIVLDFKRAFLTTGDADLIELFDVIRGGDEVSAPRFFNYIFHKLSNLASSSPTIPPSMLTSEDRKKLAVMYEYERRFA